MRTVGSDRSALESLVISGLAAVSAGLIHPTTLTPHSDSDASLRHILEYDIA